MINPIQPDLRAMPLNVVPQGIQFSGTWHRYKHQINTSFPVVTGVFEKVSTELVLVHGEQLWFFDSGFVHWYKVISIKSNEGVNEYDFQI